MPTYEYEAVAPQGSCARCRDGFEVFQPLSAPRLEKCPDCGAALRKRPAAPAIGRSISSLDQRARAAGFSKLQRVGRGEYEKKY